MHFVAFKINERIFLLA